MLMTYATEAFIDPNKLYRVLVSDKCHQHHSRTGGKSWREWSHLKLTTVAAVENNIVTVTLHDY